MSIKTILVDDESLAREKLRGFLEPEGDVEIVGECRDGREALETIEREQPDLVFLDVQMPEMDGFEVLDNLEPDALPTVVFVTAYDQYAIKAFDVHAVDYLLKPFDRERFGAALDRARAEVERRRAG
ncbi:MAG: response regulator, partial [bacterium]|nr:response regulator [bacterium]